MENRRINGVFFDLGWTLEKPKDDDWTLTSCFFEHVGRERFYAIDETLRKDALTKAYQPLMDHHLMKDCEDENHRFETYYDDLNRYLNLGLSKEQTDQIAFDHTYNFGNYVVFDSTMETLKKLKEYGYRIGVISDTWPSTVPQQKEAGLWQYYDCTTLSCFLGVYKPNPGMYEDALKKMGIPAEQTIYVDDLPMSLNAAGVYGIHGIRSLAMDPSVKETRYPSVSDPSGIFDVLKKLNNGNL